MRYKIVKNATNILSDSEYLVKKPENYKNKWQTLFNNNHPICLELGMGYGSFIIKMALENPNVNYIGLELDKSQTAKAIKNIANKNH